MSNETPGGFNKGDKVIMLEDHEERAKKGMTATVVGTSTGGGHLSLEFDQPMDGHSCNGRAKQGYGWNVPSSCVKKVEWKGRPVIKQIAGNPFKIGDKVELLVSQTPLIIKGMVAVVKEVFNETTIGLAFAKNINGHTLDGRAKKGCGWRLGTGAVKKISPKEYKERLATVEPNGHGEYLRHQLRDGD